MALFGTPMSKGKPSSPVRESVTAAGHVEFSDPIYDWPGDGLKELITPKAQTLF